MGEPNEKQDIPSAEQEDTPEEDTQTFTREQVGEAERKAKSDVSAELGRVRKLNEDLIKSSQAIQERLTRRDREEDERERERHRDEPDKLSAIDERGKRRDTETELADVKQKLSDSDERIRLLDEKEVQSTKERNAREIAARLGVDANLLGELAKLTDGSSEAITEKAKLLPKQGEVKTLTVDSSKTSGAGKGKKPTAEEVKAVSPAEWQKKINAGEWIM